MKQVSPELFYGPAPKSATIKEILSAVDIVVNLRDRTDTSEWYVDNDDEHHQYIAYPISDGTPKKLKALCQTLVYSIKKGKRVYIHDYDGCSTLGPLLLGCWYWLTGKSLEDVKKLHKEFRLCPTKDQLEDLALLVELADKMNTWENLGINIQKRTIIK
jgi:hypothetical protein